MGDKIIKIPKWQFETINNALRLTHRINNCNTKETAFDREVVKAYEYSKSALAEPSDENAVLPIHGVVGSALPCTHPADKLSDWHDNSILCLVCNCIVSQNGENIEPPTPLCG